MNKDFKLPKLTIRTATLLAFLMMPGHGPALAQDAAADGARQVVDRFHSTLLGVMKQANSKGVAARYAMLEPEVARSFDSRLMIALATGKHWRTADKTARTRLTAAFHRMSTATYASRFSDFSGQSFATLDVRDGPRKTRLVRTELRRPDESPVALTYVTRNSGAGWRIVDVLVDGGISELAVRRSEYRAILATEGVDGLIRLLDRKSRELLTEGPGKPG